MKIGTGPVVVPWDFTKEAENALKHAIRICRNIQKDIALLHIVRKKKEEQKYLKMLSDIALEDSEKYELQITAHVKTGKIFTDIGKFADEQDAELVIMGTHGVKGMQKITGSWALKVIIHSNAPFIVVKEPPAGASYKKVVLPIDYKTETKEKMNFVRYLSKLYDSQFFVLKPNFTDVGFIQKTKANIAFCKHFLDKRSIQYEVHMAEGKKNFSEESINFAKKKDADLILIVASKNLTVTDYMMGAHEQYIIGNESGIPVMVVNPAKGLKKFASFN
jgi:nucleotide-binding universal stress UspA family protein